MSSPAASRVEVWIWVLIYSGLLLLGLGLAVQRGDASLGWIIAAIGISLAAVGAVLIWVRSRMKSG